MADHVTMIVHGAPVSHGYPLSSAEIADTPENREWLETLAIPRCKEWREANREALSPFCLNDSHRAKDSCPAPYCCSAYCARCAGLRALNGDDPQLTPNEWITHG